MIFRCDVIIFKDPYLVILLFPDLMSLFFFVFFDYLIHYMSAVLICPILPVDQCFNAITSILRDLLR